MKNLLCTGLLLSVSAIAIHAQTQLGTGAITGTVEDPSGRLIEDAKITVTNVDTGLNREIVSTSNGSFTVPVLPPRQLQSSCGETWL